MSFLHALATRHQRQQRMMASMNGMGASAATEELCKLPRVTCYERSAHPGGIWVSSKEGEQGSAASSSYCESASSNDKDEVEEGILPRMYSSLWSIIPKEMTEFSDYTYSQHFGGKSVPVFLPRKDLLQYITSRATSVDPDIFNGTSEQQTQQLHQIKFRTEVLSVDYDAVINQFIVKSRSIEGTSNGGAGEVDVARYDYCIWAGGQHGKPRIPRPILHLLRVGGSFTKLNDPKSGDANDKVSSVPFKGKILHSSHMSHFNSAVRDKRVVLIGDASSAEDLALQAVKLGCQKCFILSRSGFGNAACVSSWPKGIDPSTGKMEPKVEVYIALPTRVFDDGSGLECNELYWDEEVGSYEIVEETPSVMLNDVQTVIFCTGYLPDQDCLAEDLQFPSLRSDVTEDFSEIWVAPDDFKMRDNPLTAVTGDIQPSEDIYISSNIIPGVYRRTLLMSNPRMMYLSDAHSECSLLELDISAWLCIAYITGITRIPSKAEMKADLDAQMIEEMHIPYLRYYIDMDYFDALSMLDETHWSEDINDPRTTQLLLGYMNYNAGLIARNMRSAHYPVDFGTYNNLNEKGNHLVKLMLASSHARQTISSKSEWATFRDVCPKSFRSIYTGQEASSLPGHWLDLDKGDKPLTSFTILPPK